jgi:hypothetical protein
MGQESQPVLMRTHPDKQWAIWWAGERRAWYKHLLPPPHAGTITISTSQATHPSIKETHAEKTWTNSNKPPIFFIYLILYWPNSSQPPHPTHVVLQCGNEVSIWSLSMKNAAEPRTETSFHSSVACLLLCMSIIPNVAGLLHSCH